MEHSERVSEASNAFVEEDIQAREMEKQLRVRRDNVITLLDETQSMYKKLKLELGEARAIVHKV